MFRGINGVESMGSDSIDIRYTYYDSHGRVNWLYTGGAYLRDIQRNALGQIT